MTKSLLAILNAVRLIRDKLLGIEKRLRANEIALKSMRVLLSQVNVGLRAQLAARQDGHAGPPPSRRDGT